MNARTVLTLVAALLALALPLLLPQFQVTLMIGVIIAALVVLGLVLLTGVSGLTSFGQAAFMGVGAYTTAVFTTAYGLSPWLTLPLGFVFTGLVAAILGFATLRMQGHYLPLATIAWGISLFYVFGNSPALGGFTGIGGIPPVNLFGLVLDTPREFAYLALAFLGVGMLLSWQLLGSRTGRAMRALRTGTVVAESFGANTFVLRVKVFVASAMLASAAGWLYAHQQQFVNPTPFNLNIGIEFLFMNVLGGSGAVWGAIAGSALFIFLRDALQAYLPLLTGQNLSLEIVVLGLLVILVLQLAPGGLWSFVERFLPQAPLRLLQGAATLPTPAPPAAEGPLLQVERALKQFGGLKAVDDVSFELRRGEILGLIGPNGAGKSTMFNLVTGVAPATSGRVTFGGQDITRMRARDIHRLGLARTFQHVKVFPELTLLENAMMGGYARGRAGLLASMLHLERREEAALQQAALAALGRVGLREQAAEKAGNLPLGQTRLLEIARALVAAPTVLLLDEPAAGLRFGEKEELAALLRKLREEGITILLVEHDMDLVMNLVDRLVVMNSGQFLAEGPPAAVRANPAVREAYLGADLPPEPPAGPAREVTA